MKVLRYILLLGAMSAQPAFSQQVVFRPPSDYVLQSAGVFKYLYEKYGVEKMKRLWSAGFEQFSAIYGFSIEQLESDWLNFIPTVPVPEGFDIDKLKEGCG